MVNVLCWGGHGGGGLLVGFRSAQQPGWVANRNATERRCGVDSRGNTPPGMLDLGFRAALRDVTFAPMTSSQAPAQTIAPTLTLAPATSARHGDKTSRWGPSSAPRIFRKPFQRKPRTETHSNNEQPNNIGFDILYPFGIVD